MRCEHCSINFDVIHGRPVLVDFADSVLDRAATLSTDAGSLIPRFDRQGRPHPQVAANVTRLSSLLPQASRLLVIGGGEDKHGLGCLTARPDVVTITFDIYANAQTDFVADAHSIPIVDESVDCVVIQAVLEHVLNPWVVVGEILRVLRPGGLVYAETPFLQQVHEGAYDFTRFTESGHRWLFREFEMVDSGAIGGPILVMAWTTDYLLRGLRAHRLVRSLLKRISNKLLRFDAFLNRTIAADSASAVYFTGRKKTDHLPLTPADIIKFYSRDR